VGLLGALLITAVGAFLVRRYPRGRTAIAPQI
jgi:hypothetical protein